MSPPDSEDGGAAHPAVLSPSRRQAAEHHESTAPGRPDDPDAIRVAHLAVGRLLRVARRLHGELPALGTPEWMTGQWLSQSATLAVYGLAWLVREDNLDRIVAERLKAASVAISEGGRWDRCGPSHAALERRRAALGPLARTVDPVAAARWAATGSSRAGAA